MLAFDDELVSVGRNQFHVHRIRTLAAAELVLLDFSHFFTAQIITSQTKQIVTVLRYKTQYHVSNGVQFNTPRDKIQVISE